MGVSLRDARADAADRRWFVDAYAGWIEEVGREAASAAAAVSSPIRPRSIFDSGNPRYRAYAADRSPGTIAPTNRRRYRRSTSGATNFRRLHTNGMSNANSFGTERNTGLSAASRQSGLRQPSTTITSGATAAISRSTAAG